MIASVVKYTNAYIYIYIDIEIYNGECWFYEYCKDVSLCIRLDGSGYEVLI